jgi:uncharacterized protein YfaP (DUF2135 family)
VSTFIVTGQVLAPPFTQTALTAEMRWSTVGTDVDLHLVRAGGSVFQPSNDCFFDSKNPDWGNPGDQADDPFLDKDDYDGIGPEQINLSIAREPSYEVYVHYYRAPAGLSTTATVTVSLDGVSVGEYARTFASCGQMWFVGTAYFSPPAVASFVVEDSVSDFGAAAGCP